MNYSLGIQEMEAKLIELTFDYFSFSRMFSFKDSSSLKMFHAYVEK